ncbi:MAG TPA: hypothetical protein VEJ67_02800 [Candidatus Cybelea sp.]|nr:hypothetical protein [Candidatus Cybelea sp.]
MIIKAPGKSVGQVPQSYGLPVCRADIYTVADGPTLTPPPSRR